MFATKAGKLGWSDASTTYWLALPLFFVLSVLLVCTDARCGPTLFDQALLTLAQRWRTPQLDQFFSIITWGGSLKVLAPVALALMTLIAVRRGYRHALFLGAALAGASILCHGAKLLVLRPRPALFEALTAMPEDFAFPSAHTAQAAAFGLAACMVARSISTSKFVSLCSIAAGAVALVGLSRIYLQVHYPTDVLAGAVMGVLWVMGLWAFMMPRARNALSARVTG
jgi:undecaprenyl-diphosphatase